MAPPRRACPIATITRTSPATRPAPTPRPRRRRSPAAARSSGVVRRAMIGPHGSSCCTTISRRFISSSMARKVTATTTRSWTPRSRSWSTTTSAPASACRIRWARSVSVTVRRIVSGGRGGGGTTVTSEAARASISAPDRAARRPAAVPRRRPRPGLRSARGATGRPAPGLLQQPGPRVTEGAIQDQPRPELGLGVRALVRQGDRAVDRPARQHGPRLDQDQLARDGRRTRTRCPSGRRRGSASASR